jgi:branched-chain amino acid transport system substrate-binding protein
MLDSRVGRRVILGGAAALAGAAVIRRPARAAGAPLKLGVLTDLSSVYADLSGPGSVVAAQMAVEDFGGHVGDTPVEVISADFLQKPDVGSAIARQWFDTEGVQAILDVPNSAVALSVSGLAREKNKVMLASGNITNRLTGDACSPNTVQWTIDAYALVQAPVKTLLKNGQKDWFFITMDVPSGADMEAFAIALINAQGGRVLGHVRHPLNNADFSALLLQAQASKANVVGLLNGGADFINAVKQAYEFGIPQNGQKLIGPSAYVTEFHALGCRVAQGTLLSAAYYWDKNDGTRDFAKRFAARRNGRMPTQFQAGVYSAALHYMKSVAALGSYDDGRAVVAKMKALPTDDIAFGKGSVRIDGRKIHPVTLYQIKTPAESQGEWDLYKPLETIPASEAWRPLNEEGCNLVSKS